MDVKRFDEIVDNRLSGCKETLCAKGEEYARGGDRLHNFKAAARRRNCSRAQALAGMKVKHEVSIEDIIADLDKGILPTKKLLAEKIGDDINYLLLLEAVVEEMRDELEARQAERA